MNDAVIDSLAESFEIEHAREIAAWVVARFNPLGDVWKSSDPDEAAFKACPVPPEAEEAIREMGLVVAAMVDLYLTLHLPMEWQTLMACLVAEMQIRRKLMAEIRDGMLDADKQERAYALKADQLERMPGIRAANAQMVKDVVGTGAIGDKATRIAALITKSKVTPEGRSRTPGQQHPAEE